MYCAFLCTRQVVRIWVCSLWGGSLLFVESHLMQFMLRERYWLLNNAWNTCLMTCSDNWIRLHHGRICFPTCHQRLQRLQLLLMFLLFCCWLADILFHVFRSPGTNWTLWSKEVKTSQATSRNGLRNMLFLTIRPQPMPVSIICLLAMHFHRKEPSLVSRQTSRGECSQQPPTPIPPEVQRCWLSPQIPSRAPPWLRLTSTNPRTMTPATWRIHSTLSTWWRSE